MDTTLLIVAAVLFLVQVFGWLILPNAKQVPEKSKEFSSIGDEAKAPVTV